MKKKIIATITIFIFLLICIFLYFHFRNYVHVKVVELPKTVDDLNLNGIHCREYIDDVEAFQSVLIEQYTNEGKKTSDVRKIISQEKIFKKYDEEFFKNNFLYIALSSEEYDGSIHSSPLFNIKKSYISKNNKLIIEANITMKPTRKPDQIGIYLPPFLGQIYPRGYILELPRKVFKENNMNYDDIIIAYLNSNAKYDWGKYNVQIGKDKFEYGPRFPEPKNYWTR